MGQKDRVIKFSGCPPRYEASGAFWYFDSTRAQGGRLAVYKSFFKNRMISQILCYSGISETWSSFFCKFKGHLGTFILGQLLYTAQWHHILPEKFHTLGNPRLIKRLHKVVLMMGQKVSTRPNRPRLCNVYPKLCKVEHFLFE